MTTLSSMWSGVCTNRWNVYRTFLPLHGDR